MLSNLTPRRAILGAAFTSLIMGGFIVISRFGIRDVITPADLTFFRYLSGLVLLPIFLKRPVGNLGGVGWAKGIFLTITAGWVFNMLLMSGFHFAPASHGAVFGPGTMPSFTVLLSWLILGDKLTTWRIAGLAVIFVGLIMLGGGGFFESAPDAWKGDLLFASAALCWAGFAVGMRKWNIDPLYGISLVAVLSLITFTPIYFGLCEPAFGRVPWPNLLLQLFYQCILVGTVAVTLFTISIPVIGPGRTALFMVLVPVFGTLLAIPFLGEVPGMLEISGIVIVICGLLAAMGLTPAYGRKTGHKSTRG